MAKKKEKENDLGSDTIEDFSEDLINALNAEFSERIAYNLSTGTSPTHVKRWLSTGSRLLDYIISNRRNGGVPEGRIIEIFGEPSTGKSHIALAIAKTCQAQGGLVVLIDSENATPVEKLADMGIDVSKRFVYCDTHMTENVFQIIESVVKKAAIANKKRDVPILVIWDSVAATSPKQELEGDYDESTMGLQARVISKAMRKITGVIGQNNVTFLCLNQVRSKIGVSFGDPTVTPGGKAIPFHASVRLGLTGGSSVKDKDGNVIGINTYVTTKKNKLAPPFRRAELVILFGEGIAEAEPLLEILMNASKKGPVVGSNGYHYHISGAAWREFTVANADGEVILEKKFQKPSFADMLKDPEFSVHLDEMIDTVLVVKTGPPVSNEEASSDTNTDSDE